MRAARRARDRHRQLDVEGESRRPTARIARPGSGHDCTCAQTSSAGRRVSPSAQPRRASTALTIALVVAVVVRDVAARAQQAAHRPAERGREARSRPGRRSPSRRPRAAPRRCRTGPVSSQCARDGLDAVHQRRRRTAASARCRRSRRGLRSTRCRPGAPPALACRRSASAQRLVVRAAAGAPAGQADLEQHLERHGCRRWRCGPVPRSARAAPASRPGTTTRSPACSRQQRLDARPGRRRRAPGWRSARCARRRRRRRRAGSRSRR